MPPACFVRGKLVVGDQTKAMNVTDSQLRLNGMMAVGNANADAVPLLHSLTGCEDAFLGSSVATVTDLLGKEAVHAGPEEVVLGAVLRWVGHDEQARGQHLEALLGHVDLNAASFASLLQASGDEVVRSNMTVLLKLTDALRSAGSATERAVSTMPPVVSVSSSVPRPVCT